VTGLGDPFADSTAWTNVSGHLPNGLFGVWRRLHTSAKTALVVPVTRSATIGDRAFAAAAFRTWNNRSSDVTTSQTLVSFHKRMKTFFCSLFSFVFVFL
jgi:hypothetical protein